jgi:class 3 adenylate cyclase
MRLMTRRTQYVRSGDADIAYQVIGEGPPDVVLVYEWASHLEAVAELPLLDEFHQALGRFSRLLWFDMRGIGMSRSRGGGGVIPVESWVDDLEAVMDALGSREATIVAQGQAAQMAVVAAATHPDRVTSLVLVNGFARYARADDYPAGMPPHVQELYGEQIEEHWGTGAFVSLLGPSVAERPGIVEWWARVERYGATPGLARARFDSILALDVRDILPLVAVPTLVIHNRDDAFVRVGHGRYLAEHIRDARLLERDSADHWLLPEPDLVGAIEEFVTGSRSRSHDADRVLATVLFVDVVGSTEQVSDLGDRSWQLVLDRFRETARDMLALYAGELVDTAGDGFLATFDGPARAIRCAWHIRDELRRQGLEVRAGLHVGEVSRRPGSVAGITVHIGARVSALAAPGEVLVTRTVRDLVAGSGIAFEQRGEHELKGVPDSWALYAAVR